MKKLGLTLGLLLGLSSAALATCPDAESVAKALFLNNDAITNIVKGSVSGVDKAYISNKISLTVESTSTNPPRCHYNLGQIKLLTIIPSSRTSGQ